MNLVIVSGRLAQDPKISESASGSKIARFSIASQRSYKNKETGQYDADFISCVAFGKTADFIEKFFKKGSGIEIQGTIVTGNYTNKDGQKIYTTDINVSSAEFAKGSSGGGGQRKEVPSTDQFVKVAETEEEELPWK